MCLPLFHSAVNSDLHFTIRPDGLGGSGLSEQGFSNLWAAARATWGLTGGKYFYEVKVEKNLDVDLPDTEEHPNALRLGWSVDEAGLGLGEALLSYGYGSTGKVVVNNRYNEYGETYGPGDTIGCYVVRFLSLTFLGLFIFSFPELFFSHPPISLSLSIQPSHATSLSLLSLSPPSLSFLSLSSLFLSSSTLLTSYLPFSFSSQDLESSPATISFSKNGNYFGTAFILDKDVRGKAIFPHVSTKNVEISLNFNTVRVCLCTAASCCRKRSGVSITLLMSSPPSFLQPTCETPDADGYAPLQTAAEEHKERSPKPPEKPSDCEVGGHVHMTATSCTW